MANNFFETWMQAVKVSLSFLSTPVDSNTVQEQKKEKKNPHPLEAEIGSFKKTIVYQNDIFTLYSYAKKDAKTPLLIVNPLINGSYILDLLPEISLIRHWSKKNIAVYLIEWKNITAYHKKYDFEYYVKNGVSQALEEVFKLEQQPVVLAGHCLGGLLTSAHLACGNDSRVKKYLSLNSPYDLSKLGKIKEMAMFLNVDETVDFFENIPAEQMKFLFQMINPVLKMQAMTAVFFKSDPIYLRTYRALLKWREDHINMPGEFARFLLKDLFQENRLFNEEMKLFGKKASLKKIKVPTLNVISQYDELTPFLSCQALIQKAPQTKELILPDGHLALVLLPSMEIDVLPFWEKITKWILA